MPGLGEKVVQGFQNAVPVKPGFLVVEQGAGFGGKKKLLRFLNGLAQAGGRAGDNKATDAIHRPLDEFIG